MTRPAPAALQLDLLCCAARILQIGELEEGSGLRELLIGRLVELDAPRLYSHLTRETFRWMEEHAGEVMEEPPVPEPTPEPWLNRAQRRRRH